MTAKGLRLNSEEIFSMAQEAADRYLAPRAEEYDKSGELPIDNFKEINKFGLMGLLVPEEYGGLGGTATQFAGVSEILAKACPSTAMAWGMHTNQYINLVEHGTGEQKDTFLRGIANGEVLCASGTSEPGTGGNFFYCNSAAEKTETGWKLTATKPVVTSAKHADLCFVITRANPEAPGNLLSFFIVPCKQEGVKQIGEWNTVGMRATDSSGLQFDDVKLNSLNLLGQEGGFGPIAITSMVPLGLLGFSATWLGMAQAAYDFAVEHIKKRVHNFSVEGDEEGHSVASYESVQRQISEANVLLHQTRALLYDVARDIDDAKDVQHQPLPIEKAFPIIEKAMALRIAAGENAVNVTTIAMRVAGAHGYRRDYLKIERCHRDAMSTQVMAPTPDLIKVFMGKLQLGFTFEQAMQF